jgi:hypothetical protein
MKTIFQHKIAFLLLLCFIINSCSETYDLQSDTYEEALIVEATITNELKNQEIKLTKTTKTVDEEVQVETGATVSITSDKGNNYIFHENSGVYLSDEVFKAEPGTKYVLTIITSAGKTYQSTSETLTTENEIEDVTANVVTDAKEGRGVQIKVKSSDPTKTSKYYRFEYEETYKIVAPIWWGYKLIVSGPREIKSVSNDPNTKVCYSTKNSTDILQLNTTTLQEDKVDYTVRFISDQNYIISHRYSILVREYVQNLASYTFYKTLKEMSGSGSLLSPRQPGFISGNITCITDFNSKVIGFFDVSSVSTKRIFFNYADLFPGENLPPYYTDCSNKYYLFCFGFHDNPPCSGDQLINDLTTNAVTVNYYDPVRKDYYMVNAPCGDCTTFSSNVIPSFWID